jgi:hypothetical protein
VNRFPSICLGIGLVLLAVFIAIPNDGFGQTYQKCDRNAQCPDGQNVQTPFCNSCAIYYMNGYLICWTDDPNPCTSNAVQKCRGICNDNGSNCEKYFVGCQTFGN